jgi:hypothetical protein
MDNLIIAGSCVFILICLFLLTIVTVRVMFPDRKGKQTAAPTMVDISRTPLGMMAIADWDDPNDPFTIALDLGLDPMTGEPWDDQKPDDDNDPFFDDGEY